MPKSKVIAIHKPKGPTSHDIIDQVRRVTGVRKVGHAGTLDPLASGVLVVGIGRDATKRLGEFVGKEKEYLATVRFGAESSTDDAEGEIKQRELERVPELRDIKNVLSKFIGTIMQVPPKFSAVKVKGREAYKRVRAGEEFELKPREREVKSIEILDYAWPILKLKIMTGKGVYIRSIARDLGRELGVGGYLQELVRTRVGEFEIKDTQPVENLKIKNLDS